MKGKLITFEGVEGSGKSTQAKLLKDNLQQRGYEVIITYEPGETEIGQKIREILLTPDHKDLCSKTELLLYIADRAQHVEEVLRPALKEGKIVISDRYLDATLAYQGYARELDLEMVKTLNQLAVEEVIPDLTFLLDIDPEHSLKRANQVTAKNGGRDRIEEEELSFHQQVREGYLKLAKEEERIKVINAYRSKEEIFAEIKSLLPAGW